MANETDEVNPYEAPKAQDKPGRRTKRVRDDETLTEQLDAITHSFEKTRPWISFFMVMTYIAVVFLVIAGIFVVASTSNARGALGAIGPAGIILYWGIAAVYVIVAQRLLHYRDAIRRVSQSDGKLEAIADAVDKQQKFWSFVGGLAVAMLILYALAFVLGMAFAFGNR